MAELTNHRGHCRVAIMHNYSFSIITTDAPAKVDSCKRYFDLVSRWRLQFYIALYISDCLIRVSYRRYRLWCVIFRNDRVAWPRYKIRKNSSLLQNCCITLICISMQSFLQKKLISGSEWMNNIFSAITWREQVTFDEMIMISALY